MQFRDIRRNPRRNFNNVVYSKIFLIWKISCEYIPGNDDFDREEIYFE